jgi:hypothetical protein
LLFVSFLVENTLHLNYDNNLFSRPDTSLLQQRTTVSSSNETQAAIQLLDDAIQGIAHISTDPINFNQSSIVVASSTDIRVASSPSQPIDISSPSDSTEKGIIKFVYFQ